MAEEVAANVDQAEETPKADEQKIMCFVSKKMVPISETVEVEYMPHKKVRVLPHYIRYNQDAQA
jgi:hypothetical protein